MKKTILGLALSLCIMGSVVPVSASTVNTSEYGNFTYSLSKSGNQVTATTKTQKAASKLITKMTVQVNSTGKTLVNATTTKINAKNNVMIRAINNTSKKLAAFSTHEARGKTSVVKYKAEIF